MAPQGIVEKKNGEVMTPAQEKIPYTEVWLKQ